MAKAGAKWKNIDNVLKKVLSASDLTSRVARREMYQFCEETMADSKENYVPVDTGALRSTGKVVVEQDTPTNFKLGMTYGDMATTYAVIVHEDLSAFHPVGEAKYLSKPLAKRLPTLPRRLVAAVNRANRVK